MKKLRLYVLIGILLFSLLNFVGCTAIKATGIAKEMLEDYFETYNDEDIDECLEMFGDEIFDSFDSDEITELVFTSRRYLLGAAESFKVVSFDSDGSLGTAQITLKVEIEYENLDDSVKETYIFFLENKKMQIIGIEFNDTTYPLAGQLIDEYFHDYDDMQYVAAKYIPYIAKNFFTADEEKIMADNTRESAGDYKEYKITDYIYNYSKIDWDDGIYFLAQFYADMEFENEDFSLYGEISKEDNDVKFNYLEYYPKSAYKVVKEYYSNIENGNQNRMAEMYYHEKVLDTQEQKDDWQITLDIWFGAFGDFEDYQILGWDYEIVIDNNKEIEVYNFYTYTYYEDLSFNETITIVKGTEEKAIFNHLMDVY